MSMCEICDSCSFIMDEIGNRPSLVLAMKRRYCGFDKEHCALYMVKQWHDRGYTFRDDDNMEELECNIKALYPNDHARAQMIISRMVMCSRTSIL